jgi:glycine oxidase
VSEADVLVVGGGVIGLAVARHLARARVSVTVIERGTPGAEASAAAAGMLSPLAEAGEPGPFLDLLLRARSEFPEFAAELREETGIDVGYRADGTLLLALRAEDDPELEARYEWQSRGGFAVERLSAQEARQLEPAISPSLRWALRFPGDHQVENRSLARALWVGAAEAGARFRLGAEATRLLREADAVRGVELAGGEVLATGAVVLAGGCWAGRLHDLPRELPVAPVHGQLLALEVMPPSFRHVVDSTRCYLVPRADGRLIVGATVERRGFQKAVTPAGVLQLLGGALEIAPALAELPIADLWSGLRPGTPDGLPILGRDPDVAGLFYATGHFRNGILLAPLTGELIGELMRTGIAPLDLSPFAIERFG